MSGTAAEPAPKLVTRALTVADIPDVLAIEESVYDFPWPRRAFEHCVRRGYHCVLACEQGPSEEEVCGYAVMDVQPAQVHICNVSVSTAHQGQGVGQFLMRTLMCHARMCGAAHAYLEVRPSNHAARAFYDHLGFRQVGLKRDYYRAQVGVEDAYVYRRAIGSGEDIP